MALIKKEEQAVFDLSLIRRGDCIRFQRAGDTTARNGFVTETAADSIQVLYCNIQNNAISYLDLKAADVALGVWTISWTTDFQTVSHYPEVEGESGTDTTGEDEAGEGGGG